MSAPDETPGARVAGPLSAVGAADRAALFDIVFRNEMLVDSWLKDLLTIAHQVAAHSGAEESQECLKMDVWERELGRLTEQIADHRGECEPQACWVARDILGRDRHPRDDTAPGTGASIPGSESGSPGGSSS